MDVTVHSLSVEHAAYDAVIVTLEFRSASGGDRVLLKLAGSEAERLRDMLGDSLVEHAH